MLSERENTWRYISGQEYEYDPCPLRLTGGDQGVFRALMIPICERPQEATGYDVFGVHWTSVPPSPHYTPGQEPIIKDILNWREELKIPQIDRFDWSEISAMGATVDHENEIATAVSIIGPFERMTSLSAFEDCLLNAAEEPEEFKACADAIADYKVEVIKKVYDVAKPDIFFFHDDWGTSVNTFMSPQAWREMIKPGIKRMADAILDRGMVAGLHSCGVIMPLMPDIVELGITCWEGQPECNDVDAIVKQYPTLRPIRFPNKPKAELIASGWMKPWRTAPPFEETPTYLWD